MKCVVDRIEGNIAICNDILLGKNIEIDISILPKEVKEGDVIVNENGKFFIDKKLTQERYNNIKERMNRLFNKRK